MVDVSFVGDAIRYPFILVKKIFAFLSEYLVPILIVIGLLAFLYWFFFMGVRDRLVKVIVESRRKKKCHS